MEVGFRAQFIWNLGILWRTSRPADTTPVILWVLVWTAPWYHHNGTRRILLLGPITPYLPSPVTVHIPPRQRPFHRKILTPGTSQLPRELCLAIRIRDLRSASLDILTLRRCWGGEKQLCQSALTTLERCNGTPLHNGLRPTHISVI